MRDLTQLLFESEYDFDKFVDMINNFKLIQDKSNNSNNSNLIVIPKRKTL